MTIQQLVSKYHVNLDDLKDVVFTGSPTEGTTLRIFLDATVNYGIVVDGHLVLNHTYYGDADGQFHLDLRDIIMNNTFIQVPSGDPYTTCEDSMVMVAVQIGRSVYQFLASGYCSGLTKNLTNLDYLRIPSDYRMLITLPVFANDDLVSFVDTTVKLIDHTKVHRLDDVRIEESDGYIVNYVYDLKSLPVRAGVPFQLEFSFARRGHTTVLKTCAYEIVNGDFEQYAFLTETGSYENIPMDGRLAMVPEFSFENALHSSGMIKVKDDRQEIYEQNSGHLTGKAAETLCSLLSSREIYHLKDGEWKKILIVSPSVTIDKKSSLKSMSFTWRYAEI